MTMPEDLVELGRIVAAYGVRGLIKVQPHSADAEALLAAKTWWLRAPLPVGRQGALPLAKPYQVVSARPHADTVVAQLESLSDRNLAEALKGHTVWVPRSEFPAAEDDEFYWIDLVGCQLFGEHEGDPRLIGVVTGIIDNGAHAVLQVECRVQSDQGELVPVLTEKGKIREVLVPFVAAHVHTVDLQRKRLESNWPVEF
ncbi:ribosome maturation factor RimM [Alcaligenaceae bacterium]|nr:ribosome maturation factor RimM [Alcaligenaceae bacterium]